MRKKSSKSSLNTLHNTPLVPVNTFAPGTAKRTVKLPKNQDPKKITKKPSLDASIDSLKNLNNLMNKPSEASGETIEASGSFDPIRFSSSADPLRKTYGPPISKQPECGICNRYKILQTPCRPEACHFQQKRKNQE